MRPFIGRIPEHGSTRSKEAGVVIKRGQGLNYDPTNPDKFILCTGGRQALIAERDVLAADADMSVYDHYPEDNPMRPVQVGDQVCASRWREGDFEGDDVLVTSGTGALSASTPIETQVSWYQGKLRVTQGGETPDGLVSKILTPQVSGNVALKITFDF